MPRGRLRFSNLELGGNSDAACTLPTPKSQYLKGSSPASEHSMDGRREDGTVETAATFSPRAGSEIIDEHPAPEGTDDVVAATEHDAAVSDGDADVSATAVAASTSLNDEDESGASNLLTTVLRALPAVTDSTVASVTEAQALYLLRGLSMEQYADRQRQLVDAGAVRVVLLLMGHHGRRAHVQVGAAPRAARKLGLVRACAAAAALLDC